MHPKEFCNLGCRRQEYAKNPYAGRELGGRKELGFQMHLFQDTLEASGGIFAEQKAKSRSCCSERKTARRKRGWR